MNKVQTIFMELLEEYWSKNPHLSFGAVVDNLLSNNFGSKKDLYYCSTTDFIEWIKKELTPKGIITSATLQEFKADRMREYHQGDHFFAEEPKSLFIDGKFNKNNYFGGDDIIRKFFSTIHEDGNVDIDFQFKMGNSTMQGTMLASTSHYPMDGRYVFNIIISAFPLGEGDNMFHNYIFNINSDERINVAMIGGRDIDESDYLLLLNLIQESGYDFNNGIYSSKYDKY